MSKQFLDGVSIIICCYNSKNRLPETIKHLAALDVRPDINWEVLLIDNASTDNTAEVAAKEWQRYSCNAPFTVLKQPMAGKTHALVMGMNNARYGYFLVIDDDNWLEKSYLNIGYDLMNSNPKIGVLGGLGAPFFDDGVGPDWFVKFQTAYATGPQVIATNVNGSTPGEIDWAYGAGSFIRGSVWEKLVSHNFQFLLGGNKGTSSMAGEDLELCIMVRRCGYIIVYNESLRFTHHIHGNRCNWNYFRRMEKERGKARPRLEVYNTVFNLDLRNEKDLKPFLWLRVAIRTLPLLLKELPGYLSVLINNIEGDYRETTFLSMWSKFREYFILKEEYTDFHKKIIALNNRISNEL